MSRAVVLLSCLALVSAGCKKGAPPQHAGQADDEAPVVDARVPASGPPRELKFPVIERAKLANGLEVNTVSTSALPVVYLKLAFKSGAQTDPETLPGLSKLVAAMLKEGTTKRSSAELADTVEFLGADLSAGAGPEDLVVTMRALKDHLDEAMSLLAEVVKQPAFNNAELKKLKKRSLDRLALAERDPNYVAKRAFFRALYGSHPYARVDTTPRAVKTLSRGDLVRWHRRHMVAANAVLVAVGDVTAKQVSQAAAKAFSGWRTGTANKVTYPKIAQRPKREILVVDRPGSVQSVIMIGNRAIARTDDDWIKLAVANQVLGGSAASRLFMDLREKRSLTYGAYSRVGERLDAAPFIASASVRTEVTAEAVGAFFEHLDRIVTETTPSGELNDARRFLSDSFPLKVDTPGKIASLVTELRLQGLPDSYWESYGPAVREVGALEALEVAKQHIRPDRVLVVVVGQAADFAQALRQFGPVRVVAQDGELKAEFTQITKFGFGGLGVSSGATADDFGSLGDSEEP